MHGWYHMNDMEDCVKLTTAQMKWVFYASMSLPWTLIKRSCIAGFLNHTKTGMMLWFLLRKCEIEG